ncbi:RICIN domain-containing protein [Pilimelia columellifera]|uniref:Ricin B lectin domain-containing protein n=1 Tax=Pilimelia columellifera subsp. columellifera TaxID=706583 RepID=A0ABP6B1K5_9ACTN
MKTAMIAAALATGVTALTTLPAIPAHATPISVLREYKVYKSSATGLCLDSNGDGNVYTHACNGGNFQKWEVRDDTRGNMFLWNVATKLCLDSTSGGQVYTLYCNGGDYQRWNGTYAGANTLWHLATGFCLDSNTARKVYLLRCNGGNYQKWLS